MDKYTMVLMMSLLCLRTNAQERIALPGNGITEARMVDPAMDDPDKPWCYLQKSTTVIGVPYMPDAVQVTYDGAIYTRNAELCFFYGESGTPVMDRQKAWLDGWIPIVEYNWVHEKIKYEVEMFGFPLNGEGAKNVVQFVRVRMTNENKVDSKALFSVATRSTGEDNRFGASLFSPAWIYQMDRQRVVRNGELVYAFSGKGYLESIHGSEYGGPFRASDLDVKENTAVCLVNYDPVLKPGSSAEYVFKMPRVPVDTTNKALIDKIAQADYGRYRAQTIGYWKNMLLHGRATFDIPEKEVNDAVKASLVQLLLATRERDGKRFMTDGLPYPDLFLTSFVQHEAAFDFFGFKELVEQNLPAVYADQDKDGLFYDGALLHGKKLGVAQGQAIQTLCEHYFLTHDKQYIAQVYPKIKAAVSWLEDSITKDPYHLMPPAWPYDNEMILGHYTSNNLWAMLGLRSAIRIARDLGMPEDVRQWTKFQDFYRDALLKAIQTTFDNRGYVTPGLYGYLTGDSARSGFKEWQTNQEWENMSLLYPSELFSPGNPIVDSTLDRIRRDRYREGIMTYRIYLHQYITVNMMDQELAKGDSKDALIDLYNVLLHLGPTYEGFENLVMPWQDRRVSPDCPTPHAWASAKLVGFIRNMLVREYGGDAGMNERERSLYLFSLISPDWCKEGRQVAIHDARTEMGTVSAAMRFTHSGATVTINPVFYALPARIVLTVPYFVRLVKYTSDAASVEQKGNQIYFSPDVRHVQLFWEKDAPAGAGAFAGLLKRYRSESALKVANNREVITPGTPYLLAGENKDLSTPLSFDLVKQAFIHEYGIRFNAFRAAGGRVDTVAPPPLMGRDAGSKYISVASAARSYGEKPGGNEHAFMIFPEVREHPIQWMDSVRMRWLNNDYSIKPFVLHVQPGEYFVFQTGIWAVHGELEDVQVGFSDFKSTAGKVIAADQLTCFNKGGMDYEGHPLEKRLDIPGQQVQALWMGIRLPAAARGMYDGTVTVSANGVLRKIKIRLDIGGPVVADQGLDEGRRLARLSWLNSTVGINDQVTKGYIPVSRNGWTLHILGRSVEIADNGLPAGMMTYFTSSDQSVSKEGEPIIRQPFHFIIEKENGDIIHLKPGAIQFTGQAPSFISWRVTNTSDECDLICDGRLEFDGFADYHLTVRARKALDIKDIRLEVAMDKDKAAYMMGLNREGGLRPAHWEWKWDTAKNQDALWLGAVNGGLRIKWKAENYVLPLVNVYYGFGRLHLPPSWGNAGRGGVNVSEGVGNDVIVNGYSGPRTMKEGERLAYDFELLITPFRPVNKEVQYNARYYQSGDDVAGHFIHEADSLGANVLTVHQGNDLYPFINYPYSDINMSALKDFITKVHADHKRAKVYYTTRELTINLPELWPFVSLNGEVIYPGPGADAVTVTDPKGPDPWLLENLRDRKYIPAWVSHFSKGKYAGMQDLSIITTPDSRLNNFYVAGLDWMTRHMGIDGIYIDDCSLDRTTIRRARKILDNSRPDANIDMHSWNHFNQYAGYASCLNLYMELLPYIDLTWIGEARNYDTPPDYWLVEISGIPFGLPSQMLQDGGNPWRGMVYGMTNRAGWTGSPPDHIWQFWDTYQIQHKTMIGYWDPGIPVKVDNDEIKVTVYKGATSSILAIANFSSAVQTCALAIDYKKLGYDPANCTVLMPAIGRFQAGKIITVSSLEHLEVPAGEGYLIVVKAKL